jgi:ABC-type lipoprotein release transport system permease subunit
MQIFDLDLIGSLILLGVAFGLFFLCIALSVVLVSQKRIVRAVIAQMVKTAIAPEVQANVVVKLAEKPVGKPAEKPVAKIVPIVENVVQVVQPKPAKKSGKPVAVYCAICAKADGTSHTCPTS